MKNDTKAENEKLKFSRRRFLNTVGATTAGLFIAPSLTPINLFARNLSGASFVTKVAVTQAASYDRTLIKQRVQHLFESIGGISELFSAGKKVGIKVNLTGGSSNYHMVTHPEVLRAVTELIIDSGVSKSDISLVEALWTSDWSSDYKTRLTDLGIDKINLNNAAPYDNFIEKSVGDNKFFYDSFTVNQILSDIDVYVSIPKLKHHYEAGYTGALKNQIGMVPKNLYVTSNTSRRDALHTKDGTVSSKTQLPKSIADLNLARPVHLSVIDGVQNSHGGEGNWNPTYTETEDKILFAGKDPVATDSIGAYFLGLNPEAEQLKLPATQGQDRGSADNHIYMLAQKGMGTNKLSEIEIVGDGASLITSVPRYSPARPAEYQLLQNYPNPFNPSTMIRFQVPNSEYVALKIYNSIGQEIETLVEGEVAAGLHEFYWAPNRLSSGVYLLRMQTKAFADTKKLIYQK